MTTTQTTQVNLNGVPYIIAADIEIDSRETRAGLWPARRVTETFVDVIGFSIFAGHDDSFKKEIWDRNLRAELAPLVNEWAEGVATGLHCA